MELFLALNVGHTGSEADQGEYVSISQLIAPHLPLLRRYARALTGSQKSGDTYVAAVLEALIQEPQSFPGEYEPRVALYRAFTKVWNSLAEKGFSDPDIQHLPVEQRLVRLTPRTRQAFLLLGLEGFSESAAAEVLDVDVATLRKYLDDAGKELAAEIATDVLIIEDVPLIAVDIESLVEKLGHKVTGIARTHKEAIKIAKAKPPGLILADIQLADGSSGLDAVNELLQTFEVPVIFITAYPERFLTGERPEPAFLIPKPFQPATVSAVISQALFFERTAKRREKKAS
jgi:DNA-directed RNA polymerase specialized sigma24 family protein/CheY-like chemotaxis protein